jgi:hypothetical protein
LRSTAFGEGVFVAVGGKTIVTSTDGTTWAQHDCGAQIDLRAIAYGNGVFVAVGEAGTILTSSDGTSWSQRDSWTQNYLLAITYGNGVFVAVGEAGTILTSSNGINWTQSISGTENAFSGITYGDALFVVVGESNVVTSSDGITWSHRDLGAGNYASRITYGAGLFVTVGGNTIITSPDGIIWTKRTSGTYEPFFDIAYGNGRFVAVGQCGVSFNTSIDGITWQNLPDYWRGNCLQQGIGFGNGQFLAVGDTVYRSPDGLNWSRANYWAGDFLQAITYGNNQYVAVGETILTSLNSLDWVPLLSSAIPSVGYNRFRGVAYGNGRFVTDNGRFVTAGLLIYTSADGVVWHQSGVGDNIFTGTHYFTGITYGNDRFVLIGDNHHDYNTGLDTTAAVFISSNGVTWTRGESGTRYSLSAIAYGNGLFVAVGFGIVTSEDGIIWTTVTSTDSRISLTGIAFGNDRFVAVGGNIALTSPNGTTWTRYDLGAGNFASSITYGNGLFVAVGAKMILASPDGITWTPHSSGTANDLLTIAFANDRFVAVGSGGTILESQPCTNSTVLFSGFPSVVEGQGSVTITVFRTGLLTNIVSVDYAASGGSASAGLDYTTVSGTLTFLPGETYKTFAVAILNDSSLEPTETVTLALTNAVGAALGLSNAELFIADNEFLFFEPSSYEVNERDGTVIVSVGLTRGDVSGPVTVNWFTSDGTARAGVDYLSQAGALTFAPGETNKTITISVLDNRWRDGARVFTVNWSVDPDLTGQVQITIHDNEFQVAAWGANFFGQTDVPEGLSNVVGIARQSIALKSDGTVVGWGAYDDLPAGLSNVVAIATGGHGGRDCPGLSYGLALMRDGRMVAWGGDLPAGHSNVVAIAVGGYHSLALKSDGTVVAWRLSFSPPDPDCEHEFGQSLVPVDLTNVVAIAAGWVHSLALRSDGTLVAWGAGTANSNSWPEIGQSRVPTGLSNVVAIAAGMLQSLALKSDGKVVAWGYDDYGQTDVPAGLSNVVAVAAGGEHSLGLKNDGTVVAWGNNSWGQTNVPPGLSNVVAIAGGSQTSLALVGDSPPVLTMPLSNPLRTNATFSVSVATRSGRVYLLQYKDSLADSEWTALPLVPGNGSVRTLTDPSATGPQRFYSVRQW